MEVVASSVGAMVTQPAKLLWSGVCSIINTTANLRSNLAALCKEMKGLMDRREEVKHETEAAEKVGNEIRAQVRTWLKEVENLQLRVNLIQDEMVNNNKPSQCFLNCTKRYRSSKQVEEILEEIKKLLEAGSFDSGVVYPTRVPRAVEHIPGASIIPVPSGSFDSGVVYPTRVPRSVEHIPGPSIQDQTTASKALAKTMRILCDDGVQMIGIWGLGGIGKTTLVRNLNNELKNISTQPFDIIIWATVSKNWDIKNVWTQIARRLNLEQKMGESGQEMAIRLHQRLMKEKTFLLILDDVWEKIDLDNLGVPRPEVHSGCKIILTSRSMEVCRNMMTDVEIKLEVLNDEEAWQLFSQKAGDVAHLEEIRPFAEAIVRECCRLPLAIIIVGAAMRRKTKVELWDSALSELRRSAPSIEVIEAEVYKPLKLSYDSLQGNNIKSCFLYCSLFPEDFSIEISEIVQYWLAEDFIDEQQCYVDSINKGIALIENLKDSCLLEDGDRENTVKMHDVVRDVAIWIASSSKDGCKSLVRSGIGLSEISIGEFSNSNSLKRVSFMNNKIRRLPDCMIQCFEASTLLLQHNRSLDVVPERFLQGFEALRVLNLGDTCIQSLPNSLLQLGDLRALCLRSCFSLKEVPSLGRLSRLQMLDLSGTCIKELPRGMKNLSHLRQLDLSDTGNLKTIKAGIISSLSCLEVLYMARSAFDFCMVGEEEEGQMTFEELKNLCRLHILSIKMKSIPCFSSEDLSWINRLRRFQFCIGPNAYSAPTSHDKKMIVNGLNLSQESIGKLCGFATSVVFSSCSNLNKMLEDVIINRLGYFAGLKSLTIEGSDYSLKYVRVFDPHYDLLPNLEEIHLRNLTDLESISVLTGHLGLRFLKLKLLEVSRCHKMKCLLFCGVFIQKLPNLEILKVSFCDNLFELFNYHSGQNMAPNLVFPKMRILELVGLSSLRTLCSHEHTWPCLEQVRVFECYCLKRLPVTKQNVDSIKEIKGESKWWDSMEWDDVKTRSSLLPYFHPLTEKVIETRRL